MALSEEQFQELEELEAWAEQQAMLGLSPVNLLVPADITPDQGRGLLARFREILESRSGEADRRIEEYSTTPTNLVDAALAELARLDPAYEDGEDE